MHWTGPDGREQQVLLSRPLEAPEASVGVGWTPVAKVFRASFLRVERTTSLDDVSHDTARPCRRAMRQRLKPWCGLGGQHRGPEPRIANIVLKTSHFKTIYITQACTTPVKGTAEKVPAKPIK